METPKNIGRYEVLSELGRGAMGLVYKATDPNIGRTVALKTMRIDVHGVAEEEILRRFKHEAKLAGVMNHANIVTIYDAGEDKGIFYIAMEFIEGVTLGSVLREQRVLPVEQITEIARQVCAGLDYAHLRGVIHRDVKPANLMLAKDGPIKIMDFGIAKSASSMTTAGQVLGTPTYMSPEQVRGTNLDGRSDIFSFGVVLYEMLTGEKPFSGNNVTTIIYKIINEQPIPPRELDVSIHPGLSAIVTKALEKNPKERYQTGAELVRDLANYKSFGSDAEATNVISTATFDASAATIKMGASDVSDAAAAARAKTPAHAPASPASLPRIESTVNVQAKVAQDSAAVVADPNRRKIMMGLAIGLPLLIVLLMVVVIFRNRPAPTLAGVNQPAPSESQNSAAGQSGSPASANVETPAEVQPQKPSAGTLANPATGTKTVAAKTKAPALAVPAPYATTGEARISSTPSGAKVVIGGVTQPNWVTPFTAPQLDPGTYEITLSKAGYVTQTRNLQVAVGKTANLGVDMVQAGARVSIASTPAGGAILIDGKPTGRFTPSTLPIGKGEHTIEIRKDGFRAFQNTVTLKDGDSPAISPVLEQERPASPSRVNPLRALFGGRIPEGKGVVNIKTNPSGAQIIHDGNVAEKLTPLRWPMDPGTYRVTIRKEGFRSMVREFTIEKGKVTDLNIPLVPR